MMGKEDLLPSFECAICQEEDLHEIGELDNCDHCFCVRCILEWSKISNTCPLCKVRFWKVIHKQIDLERAARLAGLGEKFPGKVLKIHEIDKKDQVLSLDEAAFEDPLDTLVCMECGQGHDDELILICDSCNQGCHTYCAHPPLEEVPDGDWYCPACAPTLGDLAAERARVRRPRPARTVQHPRATSRRPAIQTRAAQARQPVAASTRARAQRHDRYEEQRAQVLEENDLYSESDSDSTSFVESQEEDLSEGEVTDDLISSAAALIASGVGQSRRRASRSRPSRQAAEQPPQTRRARRPARRITAQPLSTRRARTAGESRQRRALAQQVASSTPRQHGLRPATSVEDAQLASLPSRSHRRVESLRSNWNQIRQDEDFQASGPGIKVDLESSEDEDAMENVSLADRLKIRAAKDIMMKTQLAMKARKAAAPREPESKQRRLLNAFGNPVSLKAHSHIPLPVRSGASSQPPGNTFQSQLTSSAKGPSSALKEALSSVQPKEEGGKRTLELSSQDGASPISAKKLKPSPWPVSLGNEQCSSKGQAGLHDSNFITGKRQSGPQNPVGAPLPFKASRTGAATGKTSEDGGATPSGLKAYQVARRDQENTQQGDPPWPERTLSAAKNGSGSNYQSTRMQIESQRQVNLIDLSSPEIPARQNNARSDCAEADAGISNQVLKVRNQQETSHGTEVAPRKELLAQPRLSDNSDKSMPETFGEIQSKQVKDSSYVAPDDEPRVLLSTPPNSMRDVPALPAPLLEPANVRQQSPEARPGSRDSAQVTSLEEQNKRAQRKSEALHYVTQIMQPWYNEGRLKREEFKMVAQTAVQALFRSQLPDVSQEDAWQQHARHEVKLALKQRRIILRPSRRQR